MRLISPDTAHKQERADEHDGEEAENPQADWHDLVPLQSLGNWKTKQNDRQHKLVGFKIQMI